MGRIFSILIFLFFFIGAYAQKSKTTQIASARSELLASFLADDPAAAALWRDSLMRLEDSTRVALVWDERWLLYFWEETYGNLFDEAARFSENERQRLAEKSPPPQDSLFEWLDKVLYDRRFEIYERISRGFLTEEEKQFALMELDYLLRLNKDEQASGEWNKRLNAFLTRYPESRFKDYVNANLLSPQPFSSRKQVKKDRGFSLDLLFSSGRWRDELERTLGSPYGFEIGLGYILRRWNFGLRCNFGFQKLRQPLFDGGFEWPKNDPSVVIAPSLEAGFSLLETKKLRVFPSLSAGLSILKPPGTDGESDNPPPDYYSNFFFTTGFVGAALTSDIKVRRFGDDDSDFGGGSFVGIRLRVGYNWLNWGGENPALQGDMFFFAIGVNLFGTAFY